MTKLWRKVDALWCAVLDFLFPIECALCQNTVALNHGLCESCFDYFKDQIITYKTPRCCSCSRIMPVSRLCLSCTDLKNPFVDIPVSSLFNYEPPVRQLILSYKIKETFNLKRLFTHFLVESAFLQQAQRDGFCLVPVPSRRNSFYSTLFIAKEIHKLTGIPIKNVLKNCAKQSQKTLNRKARLKNVKNNILFRGMPVPCALLIDDVLTTGATMAECAKILKVHGSTDVRILTLASVPELSILHAAESKELLY